VNKRLQLIYISSLICIRRDGTKLQKKMIDEKFKQKKLNFFPRDVGIVAPRARKHKAVCVSARKK
jgi:hypothetical protein